MIESIKPKNASFSATLSKINTKHASTLIKMILGLGFKAGYQFMHLVKLQVSFYWLL